MTITKELLIEKFEKYPRYLFKKWMLKRGFELNLDGIYKWVYVHPFLDYVVKTTEMLDWVPPKGRILKYYLKHEILSKKNKTHLLLQPKVKAVSVYKFRQFLRSINKKGIYWHGDCHEGNVGEINGEIFIIDF